MDERGEAITSGGASSKAQGHPVPFHAPPADAAIVEALRRGDEGAFTTLVDQHHEALRRIARLYVPSPAVADEVVQDTWLAVIQGIWAFEGRSSLKTWIMRILINQSKTRAMREGRMVPLSSAELGDPEGPKDLAAAPPLEPAGEWRAHDEDRADASKDLVTSLHDPGLSPEGSLLSEEARVRIRSAVESLPVNQRLVITMRDLEECTSEEVCNVLGLSATNQRVILHRARANLRVRLAGTALSE